MIKDDKCYKRYPVYTLISTNPGFPQKKTIKKTDFWGSWSCMGTWPAPPATAETPRLGSRVHGTPGPHPRWPPVEGGLTMAMVDYGWDVDSLIPGIPQKITLEKARKNDTSSCSHLTILSQCKSPCVFVDKLLCGWMKVELIGWKKTTHDNHQSSIIKLEGLCQTWRFVSNLKVCINDLSLFPFKQKFFDMSQFGQDPSVTTGCLYQMHPAQAWSFVIQPPTALAQVINFLATWENSFK